MGTDLPASSRNAILHVAATKRADASAMTLVRQKSATASDGMVRQSSLTSEGQLHEETLAPDCRIGSRPVQSSQSLDVVVGQFVETTADANGRGAVTCSLKRTQSEEDLKTALNLSIELGYPGISTDENLSRSESEDIAFQAAVQLSLQLVQHDPPKNSVKANETTCNETEQPANKKPKLID